MGGGRGRVQENSRTDLLLERGREGRAPELTLWIWAIRAVEASVFRRNPSGKAVALVQSDSQHLWRGNGADVSAAERDSPQISRLLFTCTLWLKYQGVRATMCSVWFNAVQIDQWLPKRHSSCVLQTTKWKTFFTFHRAQEDFNYHPKPHKEVTANLPLFLSLLRTSLAHTPS